MFSQGREAKLQIRICLELELCVEKAEEILGSLTLYHILMYLQQIGKHRSATCWLG